MYPVLSFSGMVDTILNAFQVLCLLVLIAVKVNTSIFRNDVISETGSQFHDQQTTKEEARRSQETQTSTDWRQIHGSNIFRASPRSSSTPSQAHTWPLTPPEPDIKIMLTKCHDLDFDEDASHGWEYIGQHRQGYDTVH